MNTNHKQHGLHTICKIVLASKETYEVWDKTQCLARFQTDDRNKNYKDAMQYLRQLKDKHG